MVVVASTHSVLIDHFKSVTATSVVEGISENILEHTQGGKMFTVFILSRNQKESLLLFGSNEASEV